MSDAVDPLIPPPGDKPQTSIARQAEGALLAGLLSGDIDWPEIIEQVAEDDFSVGAYREIYRVLKVMLGRGDEPDTLAVQNELQQQGVLGKVGGEGVLGQLLDEFAGSFNTRAYADIVRDRSMMQRIQQKGAEVVQMANRPEGRSVDDVLSEAQSRFFQLSQIRSGLTREIVPLSDAVTKADRYLQSLEQGQTIGISSGFADLDEIIYGFGRGDLVIVAARPSVGKTAFALELSRSAVLRDHRVLMFSLEMSAESIAKRMLSMEARVDGKKLAHGTVNLDSRERGRYDRAKETLSEYRLLIDDSSPLRMEVLASRARLARQRYGAIDMLIVDYLQLVQGPKQGNRVDEVTAISQGLKSLAREMDIPVIALSQLSRELEKAPDNKVREPRISDLRDSGAIEQDADVIILLHRMRSSADKNVDPWQDSFLKVIVGKHRNGPTGHLELQFLREYASFRSSGRMPEE